MAERCRIVHEVGGIHALETVKVGTALGASLFTRLTGASSVVAVPSHGTLIHASIGLVVLEVGRSLAFSAVG